MSQIFNFSILSYETGINYDSNDYAKHTKGDEIMLKQHTQNRCVLTKQVSVLSDTN